MAKARFKVGNRFSKISSVNALRLLALAWLASMVLVAIITAAIMHSFSDESATGGQTSSKAHIARQSKSPPTRQSPAQERPAQPASAAAAAHATDVSTRGSAAAVKNKTTETAGAGKPVKRDPTQATHSAGASLHTVGTQSLVRPDRSGSTTSTP